MPKASLRQLTKANRGGNKPRTSKTVRTKTGARRVLPPEDLVLLQTTPSSPSAFTTITEEGKIDPLELIDIEPETMASEEDGDEQSGEERRDQDDPDPLDVVPQESVQPVQTTPVTGVFVTDRNDPLRYLRSVSSSVSDDSLPGQITLQLPAPLRNAYAAQKERPDQPLRDYLVDRLIRCQSHNSTKPLYLDDSAVQAIESVAHKNFDHAFELVDWIKSSTAIMLGKQVLRIDPDLIERVMNRKDPDQLLSDALSEYLTAGIEIKTGLR